MQRTASNILRPDPPGPERAAQEEWSGCRLHVALFAASSGFSLGCDAGGRSAERGDVAETGSRVEKLSPVCSPVWPDVRNWPLACHAAGL